ncbi:MAG: roadblock/LC7 domain-containing protein [Actinomycetota bacterium]
MALTEADALTMLEQRFTAFRDEAPNIHGALLATADGHPILSSLTEVDAAATAAMVAATIGIGSRLAGVLGSNELEEVSVRTPNGYLAIFDAGEATVLTVLTGPQANLARINSFAKLHLDLLREVAIEMKAGA